MLFFCVTLMKNRHAVICISFTFCTVHAIWTITLVSIQAMISRATNIWQNVKVRARRGRGVEQTESHLGSVACQRFSRGGDSTVRRLNLACAPCDYVKMARRD